MSNNGGTSDTSPTRRPARADDQPSHLNARQPQPNPRGLSGWEAVMDHVTRNKIDLALFFTRQCTLLFTIYYLVGYQSLGNNYYKRVLLANVATSALRVHQRMPAIQLSRQFFVNLMMEDSAHYLFYSFIFLLNPQVSLVLLPIALFSMLNSTVYLMNVIDKHGGYARVKQNLLIFIEKYQQSILQTIALCEIVLQPVCAIGVLSRTLFLVTPILYYRFLLLRYNSRRNGYTRLMLSQIKVSALNLYRGFRQSP